MKANEALDKLYLLPNGLISYCRNTDEDIEYACADAFIEKACKAYCRMCKMPNCRVNECKFIEGFKNYMKEE